VSHQTEERYWTDYVRVATPIVGLLLLLGVFWYWASSLIGADSEEPPPTAVASITVIADPTKTPTPTEEAPPPEDTPEATEEPTEEPTEPADQPTRTPRTATEGPTEEATEEPSCGDFEEGQVIFSADNDVNMRAEPTTDSEAIEVLTLDQPLTVLNCEPVESGGFVWWNVENEDSGNSGWVVQDWLKIE
jgi:outer membrane biosynthesis protein TonB